MADTPTTCAVSVLAPGPGATSVLVHLASSTNGSERVRLPGVTLGSEPPIAAVIAAVADVCGQPVTLLRASPIACDDKTLETTEMVVEVDRLDRVPDGFGFHDLAAGAGAVDPVDPATARASLVDWLEERRHGWSELRPAWSRPGWLARASGWMLDRMAEAGYDQPEHPRIHHLWGISVVLAAGSATGTAYLKCSGAAFPHEAVLTRGLAAHTPALLPDVVAVAPDVSWLLMRELPGPELGEGPEQGWDAGLVALSDVQHQWLGRAEELVALGARPRPLSGLAEWAQATAGCDELLARLGPTDRSAWLLALPVLVQACARLDELGPGPSLVHGDFHPWNVAGVAGSTRIFDWTDAALSHPFLDLVTYVMRAEDEAVRGRLMDRYLDTWAAELPGQDRQEAGRLALVVGALHQAQTYTELVPTILPADRGPLADGDLEWMRRCLARLEHGVAGPY